MRSHEDLEQRVHERTTAITEMNHPLERGIADRRKAADRKTGEQLVMNMFRVRPGSRLDVIALSMERPLPFEEIGARRRMSPGSGEGDTA
jgi:hypothetical protein